MMSRSWLVALAPLAALALAIPGGCSSDDESAAPTGTGSAASTAVGGSGGAGGGSGGNSDGGFAMGGAGGLGPGDEICDGFDNDEDGTVDEDCSCTTDATQPCYPAYHPPPEGCLWGEQTCEAGSWGVCMGASLPPEGQEACCTALGDTPTHTLYDAFLTAYPPPDMPKSVPAVQDFAPEADGHGMVWTQVNPGNELVDDSNGGVIEANIEAGRAMSRAAAEASMPPAAIIKSVKEDAVIIENLGSTCQGTPGGVGWAWGSILYQSADLAVAELVYLYIGFCSDGKDVEAFYYSEEPVVLCDPPQIPN